MKNIKIENILNVIKRKKELIDEDEMKKFITYKLDLYECLLFISLNNILYSIRNTKYKSSNEYKEIITDYNQYVSSINKIIYGNRKEILSLNYMENFNICECDDDKIKTMPLMFAHNLYKKYYTLDKIDDNILAYPLRGLICFILLKKTKTQTQKSLLVFINGDSEKLSCINIMKIIKILNPNLEKEIENLIDDNLSKDLIDKSYDTVVAYLSCLSISKTNFNKRDILDVLYYCNESKNIFIHLHLYFKIIQIAGRISYDILDCNIDQPMKHISIVSPIHNDDHDDVFLALFKNNKKIGINIKNCITYSMKNNGDKIKIINNKIRIGGKYDTFLKDILYSNFTNTRKKYNHNNLYITKSNEVYIPDIIQEKSDFKLNSIYNIVDKHYILKNNDIIIKKNINSKLERFIRINSNTIDWVDFINFNKENTKLDFNESLYDDFCKIFIEYCKVSEENKKKHIINTFRYLPLSEIIKDVVDEKEIEEFIRIYKKDYFLDVSNYDIVPKNNNINYLEDNFILLIVKIRFFILKYIKKNLY